MIKDSEPQTNNDIASVRDEVSMLSSRVLACQNEMQNGNTSLGSKSVLPLTNTFIADYLPFIKSLIKTYVNDIKKYDYNSLESVATEAFLLAIKNYNVRNGAFINFAALVIKRKLLNEVSKQNVVIKREKSFSSLTICDDEGNDTLYDAPDETASWDNPRRWEIDAIKTESLQYGIDFFKLNRYSPKAEKTKLVCFETVKFLIHNENLLQSMRQKSILPLKELCEATGISRKTLERHRQYIIVVALIGTDDYPYLQSWLSLRKYGVLP